MMPRTCSACHRPLKWALTVNNKWLPLDPDQDPAGNQAVHYDHTSTLRTRQLGKDQQPYAYERLYMPHVATCTGTRPPQTGPRQPSPAAAPAGPLSSNVIPFRSSRRRGSHPLNFPAPRGGA